MGAPLVSKDALVQAMIAALEARSIEDRHGLTKVEVRNFVDIIYQHSLDLDSSNMKKKIESFLDGVVGD